MRQAIYLPLPTGVGDRLYELAQLERRRVRDQALVLLEDALNRAERARARADHRQPVETSR